MGRAEGTRCNKEMHLQEQLAALFDVKVSARVRAADEHD